MRIKSMACGLVGLVLCASAARAEVKVLTAGVIESSGLIEVIAAYTARTGKKVTIVNPGMAAIIPQLKTAPDPADIVMLPMSMMSGVSLDRSILPGSFVPLGRGYIGLFKKAEA